MSSYPWLTVGVLGYISGCYENPDFKPVESRIHVSRPKMIESSANTTLPKFRCLVSDGKWNMHAIITDQTGKLGNNKVVTFRNFEIKFIQQRLILLLTDTVVSDEEYPPPEGAMRIDHGNITGSDTMKMLNELQSLNPQIDFGIVKSEPKPTPVHASVNFNSSSTVPIVKQKLSEQAKPAVHAKSKDSKPTTPIASVSPYNNRWIIKARVSNKSDIIHFSKTTTGKLFNVTFIDDSGEIRATGFNDAVDNFYEKLQVGKVYYVSKARVTTANRKFSSVNNEFELNFDQSTQIEQSMDSNDDAIPTNNFNFVPLESLSKVEPNQTVDVLGILSDIGDVSTINTKKGTPLDKRDITLVDDTGFSVRCTLWGKSATGFNTLPDSVIAIQGARVSDFGGRSLSLLSSSSIIVTPEIQEAFALQGWFLAKGKNQSFNTMNAINAAGPSVSANEKRITIEESKRENLGMSEKPDIFVVKAMVTTVSSKGTMYYPGCPDCRKKLIEDANGNGTWRCEKCDKSFDRPSYRYVLSVCVNDETDQFWASCFEEAGVEILGLSADELHDIHEQNPMLYEDKITRFPRYEYIIKIRASQDMYQNQMRVRRSVLSITKVNFVEEAHRLLKDLQIASN